jgi:myo-inositol-1(or 4)-monophosphatase
MAGDGRVTVSERRSTGPPVTARPYCGRVEAPGVDVDDLLALARSVAEAAGSLLLDGAAGRHSDVGTKTSPTDMVTEMDRASEALVVAGLLRARPDDGVLGEEGTTRPGTSGVRWVVDPLDGTTNYLYGFPAWAVSVAAEVAGEVVAAAVADPSHGEVFTATRGGGAACNGRPLALDPGPLLETALVGTGFSYESGRRARQAAVLAEVLPRVRDVRRAGAAALDLCWVAAGRLDAFYERGLQPWDLAAGALVATEAGACTGDLDGGPPSTAFALAAAPGLFDPLCGLLRNAGAATA